MKPERRQAEMAVYETIPSLGRGGFGQEFPGAFPGSAESAQQHGQSLWSLIDDRMRGRWKWAILLALALGLVLGVLGYATGKPMFESVGVVRISPPSIVMTATPEMEGFIRNYDRIVATQMQYIKGQRCLQEALKDEQLLSLPFAKQDGALRALRKGLTVAPDRDSEFVYVSFESEDPEIAEIAVNAVLRSYDRLYAKDGGNINATMETLDAEVKKNARELASLQTEKQNIVTNYDTRDLKAMDTANQRQIAELENRVKVGKFMLLKLAATQKGTGQVTQILPDEAALDRVNSKLPGLRTLRDQAQLDFRQAAARYLPGTAMYEDKKRKQEQAEAEYTTEFELALAKWQEMGSVGLNMKGSGEFLTAEDLANGEQELARLKENQKQLVLDSARLEQLTLQENQLQDVMKMLNERMRNLQTEKGRLTSVITVANWGARPDEPSDDARRRRGVIGLGFGMMASFGTFFLLGTIDRRAFGARQLGGAPGSHLPTCLGVLPDLGSSLRDPETSDVASHCVHQIRNQIEAIRDPQSGYVLAITSPFQGDGKTSIIMALGWSYAAAGFSTLLIDCDMVGRSLTRQLGLVGREGLKDALAARELNGSISRLPVDHLSAVPVGLDPRFGPENVRRVDLERILDQVRGKFDIILIDTGPMLGALESTPVTAAADGVVLSVRRGRSRSRLEDCVNRLHMVGTHCIGVILNCAVRSDCNRYVSEASLAAAEEERAGRKGAIVQVTPGERNVLMRAMQESSRARDVEA